MSEPYENLSRKELIALMTRRREQERKAAELARQKQQERDAVLQRLRAEDPASVEAYLRQELQQQDVALQEKESQLEAITRERDEYKLAYNELIQKRFRNQSERYIGDPKLLNSDMGNTPESEDAAAGLADAVTEAERVADTTSASAPAATPAADVRPKRKKKRDESFPAHLRREEVVMEASAEVQICPTHGERKLLPQEMWGRTEKLVISKPELYVLVTLYPKYACASSPDCGLLQLSHLLHLFLMVAVKLLVIPLLQLQEI